MKLKKMPNNIINRIVRYEDLIWKKFKGNDVSTIIKDLPQTLQYEAQYHFFKDLIQSVSPTIFPKDDIGAIESLI